MALRVASVNGAGLEAVVARACVRWVGWVERRPAATLAVSLACTVAAAAYAAVTLGIDADPRSLIAQHLPFQVRQRQLAETFHTLGDGFLVVIDADSPVVAGRAAEALAARLAEQKDLFTRVDVPGGGPFFARNALLYLDSAHLDDLATRLGRVQPFLGGLARDQSLVGIAGVLGQALAASSEGTSVGLDLTMALDRISEAIEATTDHRPAADPWGTALLGGALPAEARQRVVALGGRLDYGTLLNARPHVEAIRAAAASLGLVPGRGIRVRVTGEPVLNYEELVAIGRQVQVVGVVSFALFVLAVVAALRSRRVALALVAGLLVGIVWSNFCAAVAIGHLNQISATVNVLIIGLGGELQIHVCMRYLELVRAGRERRAALLETAASMGPALFSSACTTAIGFYIFLLTDFVAVGHLGLIAGTGMFLSFVAAFTVVPAVLAAGSAPAAPPAAQRAGRSARLAHLPLRFAGPIRVAALGLAAGAALLLPRVRFNYNLLDLRDPGTESVQSFEDLLARSGSTPWTIDVIAPDLDRARSLARRLAALDVVVETRTLEAYVPGEQEDKLDILATAALFVPPEFAEVPARSDGTQRAALESLAARAARTAAGGRDPALAAASERLRAAVTRFLGGLAAEASPNAALARLQANVVGSLPEQLRELRPLLMPERVTVGDLPRAFTDQMLAGDGRARVQVYPREDLSDSAALERFVDRVRAVAPEATGSAVWQVEWGRATWHAMVRALTIGLACMVVFLIALWRSVWDTVLAFFPIALAMMLTGASLVVLGQPFNFVNVIVLPMLVGMGVDNGIHLVHRHRTRPDELDVLSSSTARAVFFAAFTTILTFGSLGLTSHRGLASFGQLLTLGVFLTLACYVVVLPAVLEWDDRRRRAAAG
jgi:hypothetical protein